MSRFIAEHSPYRREGELLQQRLQPTQGLVEIRVVAETFRPRQADPRLAWVDLPGMDVEDHRASLAVAAPQEAPGHGVRKDPEVRATAARYACTEQLHTTYRHFRQLG